MESERTRHENEELDMGIGTHRQRSEEEVKIEEGYDAVRERDSFASVDHCYSVHNLHHLSLCLFYFHREHLRCFFQMATSPKMSMPMMDHPMKNWTQMGMNLTTMVSITWLELFALMP